MYKKLQECIEQHDTITIFRHVGADSDALGAQFGLKTWIEETYPSKKVYALGEDVGVVIKGLPAMDQIDDDVIKNSLGIVLDTPTLERVDDQRFELAKTKFKIDHHPVVCKFTDYEIVDVSAGAACEILALTLKKLNAVLSKKCAEYLYRGIIADTLRFSINTTSEKTFEAAGYLASFGVDIPRINRECYASSYNEFQYENFVRSSSCVIDGKLAYTIVKKEDYEKYQLDFNQAKNKVYVLGDVEEFEIWVLFCEKVSDGIRDIYNGSIRSKRCTVNDIAQKYRGGGHKLASGVKGLSKQDIETLLDDLMKRIKENEKDH